MQRHAGEDVPRPILLPSILTAAPLITPRHPLPSEVIHQGGSSTGMMAGPESAGDVAFSDIAARQAIDLSVEQRRATGKFAEVGVAGQRLPIRVGL